MKRLPLLLAILCITLYSQAQQIKIVSFTVKNQLPSKTDDWQSTPGALILTAQKPPTAQIKELKLVLQIKSNGAVICGNNVSNAATLSEFTTKTFTTSELIGLLGNCPPLKDGNYTICAQFFNSDRREACQEMCREFRVEAPKETDYASPTLINPNNDKKFTEKELQGPVMFRWTPLVPKPKEPVTYRLRVWQLMQGQNGMAAIKANQPIVEKDVKEITQAVVTGVITGPCKPPYMCDFIWNVQAVNKEGKPMGRNEGTSEAWTFSVAGTYAINIDSLQIDCPIDTKYNFKVKLCNPNNATAIFDKLELVIVNGGVLGTPLNITSVTPAIGTTIPANGCIWVTGFFNYATPFTQACIKGYIKDQALPGLNKAESFTCDSLYCACDPCKTLGVSLKDDKLTTTATTSGQILLSGTLVGLNPNVVKKITMELVYYNIEQTGDSNCVKCAENKEWGNFIKPSGSAFTGYNTGLLNGINFGREWTWLTTVQKDCNGGGHNDNGGGVDNPNLKAPCATCGTTPPNNVSNSNAKIANPGGGIIIDPGPPNPKANGFALPIAVPPGSSLKCCGDKIKICIRYTIWDFCCHSCDIIKCYEIERKAQ